MSSESFHRKWLHSDQSRIMDGSMGTQLMDLRQQRGQSESLGAWWSSEVVLSDPSAVRLVHEQFVAAGATVLLTATYQCFIGIPTKIAKETQNCDGLEGLVSQMQEVVSVSAAVARETASKSSVAALVGMSCGPIGSAIPGAHEFTGLYSVDDGVIAEFYTTKLKMLIDQVEVVGAADFVALETFPRLDEMQLVLELFVKLRRLDSTKCYISFVTHDGLQLPCGSLVETVVPALSDFFTSGVLFGVGVNCSPPDAAVTACRVLLEACHTLEQQRASIRQTPIVIICKPNRMSIDVSSDNGCEATWAVDQSGESRRKFVATFGEVKELCDRFSRPLWFGGCCGTSPSEILEVTTALSRCK